MALVNLFGQKHNEEEKTDNLNSFKINLKPFLGLSTRLFWEQNRIISRLL